MAVVSVVNYLSRTWLPKAIGVQLTGYGWQRKINDSTISYNFASITQETFNTLAPHSINSVSFVRQVG